MNIAMEQTEEYVQGQLKAKYGDCFIRGNNGAWMVGREEGSDDIKDKHGTCKGTGIFSRFQEASD